MEDNHTQERRKFLQTAGAVLAGTVAAAGLAAEPAEAAQNNVPRWGMVIDLRRCVGCYSCQITCKMENSIPMVGFGAWVSTMEKGSYPKAERPFLPLLCNHCEGTEMVGRMQVPPCVKACPEYPKAERKVYLTPEGKKIRYSIGATYKRPDGAILIVNDLCIGCGKCIKACPYGARYFDPNVLLTRKDKEGKYGIGKCSLCVHRLDQGLEPACVKSCVGRSRIFGDLNDPGSEVSKLIKNNPVKVMKPDKKTSPNVYYIDLDDDLAALDEQANPKI